MTDAEKVCAAFREMMVSDLDSFELTQALADYIEAAQEMRDGYVLVLGGTRYDAALSRLREVMGS